MPSNTSKKRSLIPAPTTSSEQHPVLAAKLYDVEALSLDPRNAVEHDEANIATIMASLVEHGQRKNIVINASGVVRAGNGTLEAARRLGWKRIVAGPAPDATDAATKYALVDNRSAQLAKWKEDVLGEQLRDLQARDQDVSTLGWTDEQLSGYTMPEPPPPEPPAGETDETIPEPPRVPTAHLGDVWKLGPHLVICGDSFDAATRSRVLSKPVDLVLTDPPYAIYGSSTGIGADIADDRMVRPFFENLFRTVEQTLKPFGHVYICCDWRSYSAVAESSRAARTGGAYGLWPKNLIVWDKGHGLGNMYAQTHEFVAFYAKQPTPKAMKSTNAKETGHRQVLRPNVFKHERAHGLDRQHNAAKPPALFRELMQNSSDKGDLVVDFFGGSGTTLIAAEQLGRRAIVFEVEPKYVDVIVSRWEALTGKKATRESRSPASPQGARRVPSGRRGAALPPSRSRRV